MPSNSKVKVKSSQGRSTRPLGYDHVTTIDFNVVKPFGIWEMVPGDRLSVTPEVWMRAQAMNCPTFGKVDCITRAFFVPHRLVFDHFQDFWESGAVRQSDTLVRKISTVPSVNIGTFSDTFISRFTQVTEDHFNNDTHIDPQALTGEGFSEFSLSYGVWFQDSHAINVHSSFEIHDSTAAHSHYRFNPIGKRVWDLLYSLGYRFNFSVTSYENNYNNGTSDNKDFSVSLMPLMSYLKIFYDWYCPSEFRYLFNIDYLKSAYTGLVSGSMLLNIFDMLAYSVFLWFNDDMFSLCEHAPYSKQNIDKSVMYSDKYRQQELGEDSIIKWLSSTSKTVSTSTTSGAYLSSLGSSLEPISSWTVRAVQKVANLLQKNNLLTPRAQDYLKAKFGVEPSAARLDVSEYLGHASAPVKISDVVSTEASDEHLGQLGGKGTSYQIQKLDYSAEEFGYFILLIELRPRISYGQGFAPLCLRTEHEDFWQPETDALGFTPVNTSTLVSGPWSDTHVNESYADVVFNFAKSDNRIFGYLPKFWSYKICHGNLSGDFAIPKSYDIQSYHLFRNIQPYNYDDYIHNSLSFRYAGLNYYDSDFNRIFTSQYDPFLLDHFLLIGSFDCFINGYPFALSESWQVNADGEERQGSEQHIQSVL